MGLIFLFLYIYFPVLFFLLSFIVKAISAYHETYSKIKAQQAVTTFDFKPLYLDAQATTSLVSYIE